MQDTTTVDEFLSEDRTGTELVADLARVLEIGGTMVVVGSLAFALVCLPGRRLTVVLENVVLLGGLIIAIGAVAELSSLASLLGLDFADLFTDRRLDGAQFRAVAGVILSFSLLAPTSWRTLPLLFGAILSATSFGLDGHTVTEGPRLVMVAVNLAHVLAAGVWTGGVFALLLTSFTSSDEEKAMVPLAARKFAGMATATLAPVLLAGVVMAVLVLDSWSGLFDTDWGRLLMVKMLAVGAALALGAFHHFRVVPRLDQSSGIGRLGRTLAIEACVMLAVVVLTGFLVSASTT